MSTSISCVNGRFFLLDIFSLLTNSKDEPYIERRLNEMNVSRAKQILSSPTIIPVTYQGEQILIQSVDERTETARIYLKENREAERTVPVAMLQEHA